MRVDSSKHVGRRSVESEAAADPPNEKPVRLVKAKELVKELGEIGVSTVYRMAKDGKIPFYVVGKAGVRFNILEVVAALRRPTRANGPEE